MLSRSAEAARRGNGMGLLVWEVERDIVRKRRSTRAVIESAVAGVRRRGEARAATATSNEWQ